MPDGHYPKVSDVTLMYFGETDNGVPQVITSCTCGSRECKHTVTLSSGAQWSWNKPFTRKQIVPIGKIQIIKEIRDSTGLDLRESKILMDKMVNNAALYGSDTQTKYSDKYEFAVRIVVTRLQGFRDEGHYHSLVIEKYDD